MRSLARTHRLRTHVIAVAVITWTFSTATAADAGNPVQCSFVDGTVTVSLAAGNSATLARSGTAITVNGAACGSATVLNTDLIGVAADGGSVSITIDLSTGPFAPGATDEGDASSEIEFVVGAGDEPCDLSVTGSASADHIDTDGLAGSVNLNADETVRDDDVALDDHCDVLMIDGHEGGDTIETSHSSTHVIGGDGADLFRSTNDGNMQIDGVAGGDVVSYAATTDPIQVLGDATTLIVDPPGLAQHQLSSIETLRATDLDDEMGLAGGVDVEGLAGDDRVEVFGSTTVAGGPGRDVLTFRQSAPVMVRLGSGTGRTEDTRTNFTGVEAVVGTDGDDLFLATVKDFRLDGGGGLDTYSLVDLAHAVIVDLPEGRVSNGDRVDAIQAVIGTSFEDRIVGTGTMNVLSGRGGDDLLRGLAAGDRLLGGDGDDRIEGGAGADDCHGGAGTDILISC